jgi:hypothetical protein
MLIFIPANLYLADGFISILANPPPKSNENRPFHGRREAEPSKLFALKFGICRAGNNRNG